MFITKVTSIIKFNKILIRITIYSLRNNTNYNSSNILPKKSNNG